MADSDPVPVLPPKMADVREALLRKVLAEVAKQQNYDNPYFDTTPLPPTGANFSSQLFHATISSAGREELKLFAKVSVVGEVLRAQAPTKIFVIESHVFNKLAKIYADIEEKHNVPTKHRLVLPKFYGCSDKYLEEVLVLQNLQAEGFTTYDRLKSVDWEYASKAVEELAKLHALSITYQKEYPTDYEEATKVLKREMIVDSPELMGALHQMVGQVVQGVREENRDKIMKFMTEKLDPSTFVKYYQPQRRSVLIHSDFRQSNLMHKINEDGSVQVVIVDYQTMHPGCAANDLLYFIFTGSDGQFRRQHYAKLIDHYYEHMATALTRLGQCPEEVFPREDFDQDLKDFLPFGLMVAGMMLPMITMDAAQAPQGGSESFEKLAEMLTKTNALCTSRFNEVIDDYVAWGLL